MELIEAYKTEDGKIFETYQEAKSYEKRTQGLKSYRVDFSYDGYASVEVWAEDEYDAIEIAEDQICDENIRFDLIKTKVELTED